MRTLVIGAGAVGGYFGGRMLEAGRDVTFLVRPRRAEELAAKGLQIRSTSGDVAIPSPPTVVAGEFREPFDLILLTVKAYDLESAMESCAPAVGRNTAILPVLNGMRHLDLLSSRFGPERVLGGRCAIAATLNQNREIVHLNDLHEIGFGERDGSMSDRVSAIDALMDGARFQHQASTNIILDMWEKWVFLATLAGATCLLRATVGDIVSAPRGKDMILRLVEECRMTAAAAGYPPREPLLERARALLTATDSRLTASMLRDIESGGAIEADHVIGDLLERRDAPLLSIVYSSLKAYESRRRRGLSAASLAHGR